MYNSFGVTDPPDTFQQLSANPIIRNNQLPQIGSMSDTPTNSALAAA